MNLTKAQRDLANFSIMNNMATTSKEDEPAMIKYFEEFAAQHTDRECKCILACEIEDMKYSTASQAAYDELAEDGQLNAPDFDEQFERLTEKYAEDFRYEKMEYEQCEDGYYKDCML